MEPLEYDHLSDYELLLLVAEQAEAATCLELELAFRLEYYAMQSEDLHTLGAPGAVFLMSEVLNV